MAYLIVLHTVDACKKTDILCNSKVFVERELLTHIANVFLYLLIFGAYVEAHHSACATCGLVKPRQHVHCSGLTGSVGTEKTKDFAPLNRKRNVVYRTESTKSLDKMFYFDDIFSLIANLIASFVLDAGWVKYISKLR